MFGKVANTTKAYFGKMNGLVRKFGNTKTGMHTSTIATQMPKFIGGAKAIANASKNIDAGMSVQKKAYQKFNSSFEK